MNSFIIYLLTFRYLVVSISSKELPPCDERELYKIEYHSEVKKLITMLLCKCNADRRTTEMTRTEHPSENNTWVWSFRCRKTPKKEVPSCYEHQICKRKYLYDYGSFRNGEQYVDTTEEYCNCQDELECKRTGFLPKSMIWPHNNILSFRCTPYIYEYNELKPCVRNQTYLDEIHRYKSIIGSDSVKLNTYMKCICETNYWTIIQKPDVDDPVDENQWVRTFRCPWRSRPYVEASCEDYAICRRKYETEFGAEEPGKWLTKYSRIYCRCDKGRECLNVGRIENEIIHRCFNSKGSYPRENCQDGEIYRVDIHQTHSLTKNGTIEIIETKLNTLQICICEGKIRTENKTIKTGLLDGNEYITKYRCEVNSTLKAIKLPYCFKNEVCRINDIEIIGSEKGNETFRKTSQTTCICSFPRACLEAENTNFTRENDRCALSNETENDLETCSYYELYKALIYTNLTNSKGEQKISRKNTILLCKCNHTLYDVHNGSTPISRDPRDRTRRIQSYFCPQPKNTTKELQSCEDNEICRNDVYENYGEDVSPHVKYLLNSLTYCQCDKKRYCYNTEKQDPRKANKIINTFRCVKEACKNHELCRIIEYSGSKELERNETLCHCTGECSYRPLNSIVYSSEHKNMTKYYTCKFPSSASAITRTVP